MADIISDKAIKCTIFSKNIHAGGMIKLQKATVLKDGQIKFEEAKLKFIWHPSLSWQPTILTTDLCA